MIISRIYAFDVLPERRADWIALSAQHVAECLANEPGTLEFRWFQDATNENRFLVFERYADQAAIEAHEADDSALARNWPHFEPMLAAPFVHVGSGVTPEPAGE